MTIAASVSSKSISLCHAPPSGGCITRTASCPRRVEAYSARSARSSPQPHASRLCSASSSGETSLPRAGLAVADWAARGATPDRDGGNFHRAAPSPRVRTRVAAHAASAGEAHDIAVWATSTPFAAGRRSENSCIFRMPPKHAQPASRRHARPDSRDAPSRRDVLRVRDAIAQGLRVRNVEARVLQPPAAPGDGR